MEERWPAMRAREKVGKSHVFLPASKKKRGTSPASVCRFGSLYGKCGGNLKLCGNESQAAYPLG